MDSRGRIKVDPLTFQTHAPNIYAAGDVIGFPSLASTSNYPTLAEAHKTAGLDAWNRMGAG